MIKLKKVKKNYQHWEGLNSADEYICTIHEGKTGSIE